MRSLSSILALGFLAAELAAATPTLPPTRVEYYPTKTRRGFRKNRRNFFDDLKNSVESDLQKLGDDIPSYVASGVANFFQDFPIGGDVQDKLDLSDEQVAALPTQVLNIPPYANWTDKGWNIRFHGNIYKQPHTSKDELNDLANDFLIGTDVEDLPPSQQDQARNLTAEIYVIQQPDVPVKLEYQSNGASTELFEPIDFPYKTTSEGDFDSFITLGGLTNNGFKSGDEATTDQELAVYAQGSSLGNATAYLVPPKGLLFVSDIDDILRVTKIYEPTKGILNSFARPFRPWMNMPDIYANWQQKWKTAHFHYLTTTPEQVTRNYMEYIYATYPLGSFDTRPLNFSDVEATLSIRKYLLTKVFETFPQRKFVLVADTSNSDVMKDYPLMAKMFPSQLQCILLRNTSATDSGDLFPYNTEGFKGVDKSKYMFFRTPDDLTNLDIENGECVNQTVPQDVTFDWQGSIGDATSIFSQMKMRAVWAAGFSIAAGLWAARFA